MFKIVGFEGWEMLRRLGVLRKGFELYFFGIRVLGDPNCFWETF